MIRVMLLQPSGVRLPDYYSKRLANNLNLIVILFQENKRSIRPLEYLYRDQLLYTDFSPLLVDDIIPLGQISSMLPSYQLQVTSAPIKSPT